MVKYNVTEMYHQQAFVANHAKLETPYSHIVENMHLPEQVSPHAIQ
jgi:hypothetical protein